MVEVRINGNTVDIGKVGDFKIIIQRQLFNFENPTSQGGDHTYTVTFPASKTNDNIFGPHLASVDTVRKFIAVEPMEIEIFANGTRIFKGVPVVEKASSQGYEAVLYGTNIDWAAQLQQRSLRDIQSIPDVPFTGHTTFGAPFEPVDALTQEDIEPLTPLQTTVQFPLVAYGNYYRQASLGTGFNASRIDNIGWTQIQPCAFITPVVKAMFKDLGYNLAGGFFDSSEAHKMLTAYTGDTAPRWNWGLLARVGVSNTSYNYVANLFPSSINSDFQYPSTGVGQSLFWNLKSGTVDWDYSESYFQVSPKEQYITPVSGTYRFTIDTGNLTLFKDISGTPTGTYDWLRTAIAIVVIPDDPDELDALKLSISEYIGLSSVVIVSDPNIIAFVDFGTGYQESPYTLLPFTVGGTYSQSQTGVAGTPGARVDGSGNVEILIENVSLPMATRVEFWLVSQYQIADPIGNQDFTFAAYSLDVKETSFPDLLEVAPLLPDISQFDYLKWLITAFDLCFSVDQERRIIRFETRDLFYRDNAFAVDWSSKGADIGTVSRPVPSYRNSRLKWADDDQDLFLSTFGTSQFETTQGNDSSYAIRETELIEVGFAPTYDREYNFKGVVGSPTLISKLIIPCMASDSQMQTIQDEIEWEYNYRPRLLKYVGQQAGYWNYHGVARSTYPAARFSFDELGGVSLAFGEAVGRIVRMGGLITSPVQNQGLFDAYWAKFFVIRNRAHIQEVSVYLNEVDFAQVDVSVPVKFHGIHYWLYSFVDGFDPIEPDTMRVDLIRQV